MRSKAWLCGSLLLTLGCPGDDTSGGGSSGGTSSSSDGSTSSGPPTAGGSTSSDESSTSTTRGGEITTDETTSSTGGSSSGTEGTTGTDGTSGSTGSGSSSSGEESSESSGGEGFNCEALPQEGITASAVFPIPPFVEVSNGSVVGDDLPLEVASRNLLIDPSGRMTGWLEEGSYCSVNSNGFPFQVYIPSEAAAPDPSGERLLGGAAVFHPVYGPIISAIGPLGSAPLYRINAAGVRQPWATEYVAALPGQIAMDPNGRIWSPTDANTVFPEGTTPAFSITAVRYEDDGTSEAQLPVAGPLRGFTSGLALNLDLNAVYVAGQTPQGFAIVRQYIDDDGAIEGEPLVVRQSDDRAFHDIRFDQCGNVYFVQGVSLMRAPLAKDGSLAEEPVTLIEFNDMPAGGSTWGDGLDFDANSLFFARADGQVVEVPVGAPGQL